MSNNTNTLFLVITGAVIILSVFLLINNYANNLNRIESSVSSLYDNEDFTYEAPKGTKIYTCGSNELIKDNFQVNIKRFIDLGDNNVEIEWTAKNLSDETITNKYLLMNIYNCEDNSIVLSAAMFFDYFYAGDTWNIYTSGSKPIDYFKYYIELSIEDYLGG